MLKKGLENNYEDSDRCKHSKPAIDIFKAGRGRKMCIRDRYSFDDINVDDNGKITGLPEKMCKIMNSQEANAKYEEIRDKMCIRDRWQTVVLRWIWRHWIEG